MGPTELHVALGMFRLIAPKFAELAEEFPDIEFVTVDVDENGDTAQACGIRAMPTFKCYRKGKEICDLCGASEAGLRDFVAKARAADAAAGGVWV